MTTATSITERQAVRAAKRTTTTTAHSYGSRLTSRAAARYAPSVTISAAMIARGWWVAHRTVSSTGRLLPLVGTMLPVRSVGTLLRVRSAARRRGGRVTAPPRHDERDDAGVPVDGLAVEEAAEARRVGAARVAAVDGVGAAAA